MKNEWKFTVFDRLVGHKCSVRAAHGEAFVDFKRTVRLLANLAGVPQALDPKGKYRVDAIIYFRLKAHTDPENVRKAIVDGLWERDRRVLTGFFDGIEHQGRDRADVTVQRVT